jgi:hypothetical protein
MKVLILYHPKSEHSRVVEEFVHDFGHEHPDGKMVPLSLDTVEGSEAAALYGVTQYPAVLALNNNGELLKDWQGSLPLMNEVAYYAMQ